MIKRLKAIMKNQLGLTLIELLIALAITGIITATVTLLTFQVFDGEARANNQIDAISRVQNAGREVSRDISMAQAISWTDDEDGLPLTLVWTEWEESETHTVVYSIVDNNLYKVHSSNSGDVEYTFEYIISVDPDTEEVVTFFDPTDFSFTLTATAGIGSQRVSETREYKAAPRPSL
jgi:prepilin-type N-terminal cleavage/methylation domain-containing protein